MAAMKLVTGAVLVFLLVVAPPVAESFISCGQVASDMAPCLGYLTGAGDLPPTCCSGVRGLNSAAVTTADRQAACTCLKNIAITVSNINFDLASGLPGKCDVSIPFNISPTMDCTKY